MKIENNIIALVKGDVGIIDLNLDTLLAEGDLVYFSVKESSKDEEYLFQVIVDSFPTGAAKIIIPTGAAKIIIPSEATKDAKEGVYYYDVKVALANGLRETVITPNKFYISGGITNEN